MGFFDYINSNSRIRSFQTLNKFKNTHQITEPVWRSVEGSIPPWVNGILYRTGPGKYNLGDDEKQYVIQHAFDGLPFVHRFELSSEKQAVRYNNRMIAEEVEKKLVSNPNSNQVFFFGHVPNLSYLRGFVNMLGRLGNLAIAPSKDERGRSNEMVGVTVTPNFPLPSKFGLAPNDDHVLVTKTDANILQHVHSTTLEPERLFDYSDFDNNFAGALSAAHHQRDPKTNEIFNFAINFGREVSMTVFSIDPKGNNQVVLAKITQRLLPSGERSAILPAYIHSFWLTENYVIIPESPLHYANNGIDVIFHGVITTAMSWKESSPTYLHVISRDPSIGHVVTLPVEDPFFTFHTSNAWDYVDKNGNPVLELECCALDNGDILYEVSRYGTMERYEGEHKQKKLTPMHQEKRRGLTIPPSPSTEFGDFHRYRATWNKQANTGHVATNVIAKNVEFPRFAPHLATQKSRYVWGCEHEYATPNNSERFSLVKIDTETKKVIKFDQPYTMFSEPVFVPNPDSNTGDEDDGALLSFANIIDPKNAKRDRCILSIVDAKTMKEIGRCDIGQFHATTFHGSFVDVDFVSVAIN